MLIPMSDRDIQRFKILNHVRERRLSQIDAADILQLSTRQGDHQGHYFIVRLLAPQCLRYCTYNFLLWYIRP